MKQLVFISDLHLSSERPQIIELFLRFADEIAAGADELYILGDFLEYWLGDDDPTPALSPVACCTVPRAAGDGCFVYTAWETAMTGAGLVRVLLVAIALTA